MTIMGHHPRSSFAQVCMCYAFFIDQLLIDDLDGCDIPERSLMLMLKSG